MTLPRVFNDPLWLFLLFGGLLFVIAATQEDQRVIRVTEGDIQRIEEQWQQQMRRDPHLRSEPVSLTSSFETRLLSRGSCTATGCRRHHRQTASDPKAFLFDGGPRGHGNTGRSHAPGVSYETSRRLPNARAILFQPHLFFCGPAR